MSVHRIAQCAKMQYQNVQTVSLPTTDSYDLQAQKNEQNVISMIITLLPSLGKNSAVR